MERIMDEYVKEWEIIFSYQYAIYLRESMSYSDDPYKNVCDADEYAGKLNVRERIDFYEGYINNLNYCLKKHTLLPLRSMKEKLLDLETYLPLLSAKKNPIPKDFNKYIYYFLQREDFYSVWDSKEMEDKTADAISNIKTEIELLSQEILRNENAIKEVPVELELAQDRLKVLLKLNAENQSIQAPAHPFKNDEVYLIFMHLIDKEIKKDKARFTYLFNFLINTINKELQRSDYFLFVENNIDDRIKNHRLQQNANDPKRIAKIEYNYQQYVKSKDV